MNVVFDVIIAFFASVGFLYIVWHILMSIGKSRDGLYGTLIYIPNTKEDEEKIAELFSSDDGKSFHGGFIMLCDKRSDKKEHSDGEGSAITELLDRYERVYNYRTETIWIGQRSEGLFDIRGHD